MQKLTRTYVHCTRSEQIWTHYNWYALLKKSDANDVVELQVQSAMYAYVQKYIQRPTVTAPIKSLSFIFTGHPFNEIDITVLNQKQRETS